MATNDFPVLTYPHAPSRHPDAESVNGGDYYTPYADSEISGSGAPATPSSKRHHYSNNNGSKKQKPNGKAGESELNVATVDYREDYRKDREEWSEAAIACLIEAYTERYREVNKGNLRGKDWEEVAEAVSERGGGGGGGGGGGYNGNYSGNVKKKSVEQCKNKIDNLKKRYKLELQRVISSGNNSNWHWFKLIEMVMGNSCANKLGSGEAEGAVNVKPLKRYTPSDLAFAKNLKAKSVRKLKWRRVVFKISGAALAGNSENIDPKVATHVAREVATACRLGLEVAIVVGGRNFFCGDSWISATGLDKPMAYQIGMMATVMNAILLQSALEKLDIQTRVQSAFAMPDLVEPYSRQKAIRHLEKGRVVIFGGIGSVVGNPLFNTTDAAAALRASEINAEALLKGTTVNGISENSNVILDRIPFGEVVSKGVTCMDTMAITYCEENGIPVVIFNLLEPGNICRALCGDQVGTSIDQA
ncbi:uncharacterized protein LOC126661091 [Mercurialis annua]|uniref:uncharacterized protein LOC126661091 n=1 Tax=Mercurialis annua TaxID=3986 RepID=UPI00215E2BBF|nr:uncharacterized protein LOC126661091 [Mercurialis annua]